MNMFFIVGIRRSGTSILRELMMKHPAIDDIEFEPHPLWFAVDMSHFSRFKNIPYVQNEILRFKRECSTGKWHGAKFALNPGVKALEWKWLPRVFPEARFIFVYRDVWFNFESYEKQDKDSVRGMIPYEAYEMMHDDLVSEFTKYSEANQKTSWTIQYEALLKYPDEVMKRVFSILDLQPIPGMGKFIKEPEFK